MKEALFYKKLKNKIVRCELCPRFCVIEDGKRGNCCVRENIKGKLYSLVYGKPIAMNIDPIEKKPLYHFLPGTNTFSVGTAGCNLRCNFCFVPDTSVLTEKGVFTLEEIFNKGFDEKKIDYGFVRKLNNPKAITHKGITNEILHAFKHDYDGEMMVIKPNYCPEIKCTLDHEFFVSKYPAKEEIIKVKAQNLCKGDYLVVPKIKDENKKIEILDIWDVLSDHKVRTNKTPRKTASIIDELLLMKGKGATSREIGKKFKENENYFFVPIHKISKENYKGDVYNIEVNNDNSYLANFVAVGNCQNFEISQVSPENFNAPYVNPKEIVDKAIQNNCKSIAYTYNEPTIFYEFVLDTAKLARKHGLKNVLVSNGYINERPLKQLCKYIDAANIDLKAFSDEFYKRYTQSNLKPILNTLKILKKNKVHLEITNLIIPRLNDNKFEIDKMCRWIKNNLGKDAVVHFSRFFPNYKIYEYPTSIKILNMAREIAKKYLNYVYIGNIHEKEGANTFCPKCKNLLIKRLGFSVIENNIKNGICKCGKQIEGIWL